MTNKACSPNPVAVAAVVIAIAAAIAGCSMQKQNSMPKQNVDPTGTTSATFLGQWHVHGSTMDITATSVTIVTSSCPMNRPSECAETDTLTVVSGDDKQLTLRVVAVRFSAGAVENQPAPSEGQATAAGDSLQLAYQAPGLLKTTILHGFPEWVGGNPYWCGANVSASDANKCGA